MAWRRRTMAAAAAILVAGASAAADYQRAVEAARRACSLTAESGDAVAADGSLSASARSKLLRIFGDAGVELKGDLRAEQWTGIQQVLREHQLEDSKSYRDCVRDILPRILDLERPAAPGPSSRGVDPDPDDVLTDVDDCPPGMDPAACAMQRLYGQQQWTTPAGPAQVAQFCCDAFGNRWCQMIAPMPYGSVCQCIGVYGWGTVCP